MKTAAWIGFIVCVSCHQCTAPYNRGSVGPFETYEECRVGSINKITEITGMSSGSLEYGFECREIAPIEIREPSDE